MGFPMLNIVILTLTLMEWSEAREVFLTRMCYRTRRACQTNCRGICQKKTFMTGDCWGYTGQQCVNRLGFICRCTGDIEVVSWPRNFQINQEAYKEQQGFEQKQKKERLAAEQRAAAAEQRANYGGPMDYGGQQFPDYNDFMDDIDFGDYDSLQGQQLPQMYQMPPQWPPQQMPDSGGRKF